MPDQATPAVAGPEGGRWARLAAAACYVAGAGLLVAVAVLFLAPRRRGPLFHARQSLVLQLLLALSWLAGLALVGLLAHLSSPGAGAAALACDGACALLTLLSTGAAMLAAYRGEERALPGLGFLLRPRV